MTIEKISDYLTKPRSQFEAFQKEGEELNKDKKLIGIGGFTTLVSITEDFIATSDIPTTVLEDGSIISDQVILNPIEVTITGDISDKYLESDAVTEEIIDIQNKIGETSLFLPSRTQTQISNIAGLASDVDGAIRLLDNASSTFDNIAGNKLLTTSNIKAFKDEMLKIRKSRAPFGIYLGNHAYEKMIMTSLEISWDNEINSTGFSITAVQIRTATVRRELQDVSNGVDGATESKSNKGVQKPEEIADQTFLRVIVDGVKESVSGITEALKG